MAGIRVLSLGRSDVLITNPTDTKLALHTHRPKDRQRRMSLVGSGPGK